MARAKAGMIEIDDSIEDCPSLDHPEPDDTLRLMLALRDSSPSTSQSSKEPAPQLQTSPASAGDPRGVIGISATASAAHTSCRDELLTSEVDLTQISDTQLRWHLSDFQENQGLQALAQAVAVDDVKDAHDRQSSSTHSASPCAHAAADEIVEDVDGQLVSAKSDAEKIAQESRASPQFVQSLAESEQAEHDETSLVAMPDAVQLMPNSNADGHSMGQPATETATADGNNWQAPAPLAGTPLGAPDSDDGNDGQASVQIESNHLVLPRHLSPDDWDADQFSVTFAADQHGTTHFAPDDGRGDRHSGTSVAIQVTADRCQSAATASQLEAVSESTQLLLEFEPVAAHSPVGHHAPGPPAEAKLPPAAQEVPMPAALVSMQCSVRGESAPTQDYIPAAQETPSTPETLPALTPPKPATDRPAPPASCEQEAAPGIAVPPMPLRLAPHCAAVSSRGLMGTPSGSCGTATASTASIADPMSVLGPADGATIGSSVSVAPSVSHQAAPAGVKRAAPTDPLRMQPEQAVRVQSFKWRRTHAAQESQHQHVLHRGVSADKPSRTYEGAVDVWEWLLALIFGTYNPDKIAEVPTLLAKHQAADLLTHVVGKYMSPLSMDEAILAFGDLLEQLWRKYVEPGCLELVWPPAGDNTSGNLHHTGAKLAKAFLAHVCAVVQYRQRLSHDELRACCHSAEVFASEGGTPRGGGHTVQCVAAEAQAAAIPECKSNCAERAEGEMAEGDMDPQKVPFEHILAWLEQFEG